jgi:hypothetical protein
VNSPNPIEKNSAREVSEKKQAKRAEKTKIATSVREMYQ